MVYRTDAGAVEGAVGEGESVSLGVEQTKGEAHKREFTNKMFLHSDFWHRWVLPWHHYFYEYKTCVAN